MISQLTLIKTFLYALLLALGFPSGIFLARLCKDEINHWRGRMFIMILLCLTLILILSFIRSTVFFYKSSVILSLFFILITCITILWESNERKLI